MRRRLAMLALVLAPLASLGLSGPAGAQGAPSAPSAAEDEGAPALLVADTVFVEGDSRLVATGNVEALQDGTRLTARRIVYDGSAGTLAIDGPIRITFENGEGVLLADAAELSEGLRDGLLRGARLVLNDQLQLAGAEARRVGGRYTDLRRVAVTACQICADGRAPLWQIRAARVIHDAEERQIYFDDAQLRVLDVPVFWLPRLRLPAETRDRARGFLVPSLRTNTLLGTGVRLPYFIPIGDHRDLTLTPYLSPKTTTLEARYRQAFLAGDLELNAALSEDALEPAGVRGFFFAEGSFAFLRGSRLDFDIKTVSDPGYLNDYDLSSSDRLESSIEVWRVKRDWRLHSSLVHYETLRETERNATQPTVMADLRAERRFFPAAIGGELRLAAQIHGHLRTSTLDVDGPDDDDVVDGRDLSRLNAEISWRDRWTLIGGLRAGLSTHLWFDAYRLRQDATAPPEVTQATPGIAAELRLPLRRAGPAGGATLLEPILQLGWVGAERAANPNDESTRVEFDEGNLLSLSRFPAPDRRERGATLAAGLRWTHAAPQGWSAALTAARVWRDEADPDFSRSSGLDGTASDWLLAGRFAHPIGLSLTARGLLDTGADFTKAEARASWSHPRLDLGASFLLLLPDPAEDRDEKQSEWTLDAAYRITRHWSTTTEWRYDVPDARLDRIALGLQYETECVRVGVSATRRLADAANVEPSTSVDLTVALTGFGTAASSKEYRRVCTP